MNHPIPRLLALAALIAALLPTLAVADEAVSMAWSRPGAAAELARPVRVTVAAGWTQYSWAPTIGGGVEPGYDVAAVPYAEPPRQRWTLDDSDRFPQRMSRTIHAELGALGVWPGPDPKLADAGEVTVRVTRFRCRDPFTRGQRCVASGTMRMGMALLPDVAVVVGPEEEAPFDALASRFAQAVAKRIASLDTPLGTVRPTPTATLRRLPDGRWGQAHPTRDGTVCTWTQDRAELLPGALGDETADVRVVPGSPEWAVHPEHGPVTIVLRVDKAPYGLTTDDRLVRVPAGAEAGSLGDELTDQACRQLVADSREVEQAAEKAARLAREAQERRKEREVARAQEIARRAAAREAEDADDARVLAGVEAASPPSAVRTLGDVPPALAPYAAAGPTWFMNHDDFPYRSRAKAVQSARIEMTDQGHATRIRVLMATDPAERVDAELRFNPKGASWTSAPFERIAPGIYEAVIRVRSGTTYVQVVGRIGASRGPLLFPKPLELERL